MRIVSLPVVFFSVIVLPGFAHALNWTPAGSSKGYNFYFDLENIEKRDGNLVAKWIIQGPNLTDKPGVVAKSQLNTTLFDCSTKKTSHIKLEVYSETMAQGEVVVSESKPVEMKQVLPGSQGEIHLKLVCDAYAARQANKQSTDIAAKNANDGTGETVSNSQDVAKGSFDFSACLTIPFQECAALRQKAKWNALPQPKATAKEMAESCKDSEQLWAGDEAKQKDISLGTNGLMGLISMWGSHHFDSRVATQGDRFVNGAWNSCKDFEFRIRQWQRAIGHPETGKITISDMDEYSQNWLPTMIAYKDAEKNLAERGKISAQKREGDRQAAEATLAAERASAIASAPKIFGVAIGADLQDIPICNESSKAFRDGVCISAKGKSDTELDIVWIKFAEGERPGWIAPTRDGDVALSVSGLNIKTDKVATVTFGPGGSSSSTPGTTKIVGRNTVTGLVFNAKDTDYALSELDKKFGQHKTESIPMENVPRICNFFSGCVELPANRHWVGYRYSWRTRDFSAVWECLGREGECSEITIATEKYLNERRQKQAAEQQKKVQELKSGRGL